MEDYKIVEYTDTYKERLRIYLHKIFPKYPDEYIEYCISFSAKNNAEENPTLLVVNNKDEIVGCHLYYNTKAKVMGQITQVRWGHDTFLDEDYRHKTVFPRVISEIDAFGIGLSKTNKVIQQHYEILFFDSLYNFLWLNHYILTDLLRCLRKKEPKAFRATDKLTTKSFHFNLANNIEDIKFPKDGFWCNEAIDVEFIRDRSFLNYRFFKNKVHQYFVYHLETEKDCDVCYFVIRPIRFKGLNTLFIVDFRYEVSKPQQFKAIMLGAKKLAKHNKMGAILFTSNDSNVNLLYNRLLWKKSPVDFYAKGRFKTLKDASIFVTAADSDVDFLR